MKNRLNSLLSLLSAILVITFLFEYPATAFASTVLLSPSNTPDADICVDGSEIITESSDNIPLGGSVNNNQSGTVTDISVVDELMSERSLDTKTFRMSDGTYTLVQYAENVHYLDTDSEYKSVDNSLIASNNGEFLENKSANFKVKYSNKSKAHDMVSLSFENYAISWGYEDVNEVSLEEIKSEKSANEFVPDNLSSQIIYSNAFNNADISIYTNSGGIKEEIILKSKESINEYNVTYQVSELTAEKQDKHNIIFKNGEGDIVFRISAPYMYDSAGESSSQLTLDITEQEANIVKVKYTAEKAWLDDEKRVYPVILDPTVEIKKNNTNNISTSFVTTEYPGYDFSSNYFMLCDSGSEESLSLVKLNSIPSLSLGNKLLNMTFSAYGTTVTRYSKINIHQAIGAWGTSVSGINYSSDVVDFIATDNTDTERWYTWDISKLAKAWINGTSNYGMVIRLDSTASKSATFYSVNYPSANYRPYFTFNYKNFNGLNNDISCRSHTAGNGTGYVYDYTGGLFYNETLFESTGNKSSMNIQLSYNNSMYNELIFDDSTAGKGWQFSFAKKVEEASSELQSMGYKYVYVDEYGNRRYFKQCTTDSDVWVCENDEDLFIRKPSSTNIVELVENESVLTVFDVSKKCALSEKEYELGTDTDKHWGTYGDNITLYATRTCSNGYMISSITDSVGRKATIQYTDYSDASVVSSITWFDGRIISFTYNSSRRMTGITYPAGNTESFSYSSSRLSKVSSSTGNTVVYQYNTAQKISRVTEYTSSNLATSGNYLKFTYDEYSTTVEDKNGLTEESQFDENGRTVSVKHADRTSSQMSYSNNNVISIGQTEKYIQNHIDNSGLERSGSSGFTSSVWNSSHVGYLGITSDQSLVDDERQQYYGNKSLKISHTDTDQYFTTLYQSITNTDLNGEKITVSAYVKTKSIVRTNPSDSNSGAFIRIRFYDSNNVGHDADSVFLTGDNKWQRITYTTTVPSDTTYFRIHFGIRNARGTAWFDCLQIEENPEMHEYNLLDNPDFNTTNSWYDASNGTYSFTYSNGHIEATGKYNSDYTIFQNVPINKCLSSVSFYADVAAKSVPITSENENRKFGLRLYIVYDTETDYVQAVYKQFNTNINTRQKMTLVASTKYTDANVLYVQAQIQYCYNDNDISVYSAMMNVSEEYTGFTNGIDESEESDTDDEPGTLEPEEPDTDTEYLGYVTVTNGNSETTYYGNVIHHAANDSDEIDTTMLYTETSKTYDTATDTNNMTLTGGNFETSITDERGKTVNYNVNPLNGLVSSVTDAKNNTTTYTYNQNNHNLLSVSGVGAAGTSTNTYTYNSKQQLSVINHNGFNYSFSYDGWGNLHKTSIGNYTLSENTYNGPSGELSSTSYGNGDYYNYEYDDYGRISYIYYGNQNSELADLTLEYKYDAKNRVYKQIDHTRNNTTTYYYDLNGNLAETRSTNGISLITFSNDNSDGEVVYSPDGNTISSRITTYTTDGDINETILNDILGIYRTKDELERETSVTIKNFISSSNNTPRSTIVKNNEYLNYIDTDTSPEIVLDTRTTNFTKKISYDKTVNSISSAIASYKYTYDDNGNITAVNVNNSYTERYTYDSLNQLISHVKDYGDVQYITDYTYDTGGNITSVSSRQYYPNNQNSISLTANNYTYGNTVWKDLLTGYNSDIITYDNVGNPLNYRDGMSMTWERGRLLKSLTKNSNIYKYTYDANGIRTSKCKKMSTTDTDKYDYYYDENGTLQGMSTPYGKLYFMYDENGEVIGVRHINGEVVAIYTYIKNLQGDITYLIDEDGDVIAQYVYDAYGKVESVKNALGATITSSSHIGLLNPMRYRGYCYDNETGLYYLISRYYDPTTGRFVNADNPAYLGSNGTATSFNLYSYSEGNPINNVDYTGTDAYWLQDNDAVRGMGHTSLLIQESKGKWWYFYWGDKDIQLLYFGSGGLTKLNLFLTGHNKWGYAFYNGYYEVRMLIKGNFKYCLDYIYKVIMGSPKGKKRVSYSFAYCKNNENYTYNNPYYNPVYQNCVQLSMFILSLGKFSNSHAYKERLLFYAAQRGPIPNIIFDYLLLNGFFL